MTALAAIQRQVVDQHHWMTGPQFLNAFAISRMAPGPGSLLATLIGWQVAGFWGAVAATLGIFGPTAVLVYGIAVLWRRHQGALWQRALEGGLRPVAAGMILASGATPATPVPLLATAPMIPETWVPWESTSWPTPSTPFQLPSPQGAAWAQPTKVAPGTSLPARSG